MQSKYHHLIPQTYLTAWANQSGTLKIKWSATQKIECRNTDSVAGINHYHSIIAGMPFCTEADTDIFFESLRKYNVSYEGIELNDTMEMNRYYGVFDEWNITRANGTSVRKKRIKNQIDQIKIQDVENLWSKKYESKWNTVREIIEQKVSSGATTVLKFYFGYIMKFFVALDWRSIISNKEFSDFFDHLCSDIMSLDKIDIPIDERELPMFKTAADYMKHCLLLNYYRQFLNDTGVMYTCAKQYMKKTSFHFLVSSGSEKFIASDNPSFVHEKDNGLKLGMLPISPEILLMIQRRNLSSDDYYYITEVNNSEVESCNEIIQQHSDQFVVFDNR